MEGSLSSAYAGNIRAFLLVDIDLQQMNDDKHSVANSRAKDKAEGGWAHVGRLCAGQVCRSARLFEAFAQRINVGEMMRSLQVLRLIGRAGLQRVVSFSLCCTSKAESRILTVYLREAGTALGAVCSGISSKSNGGQRKEAKYIPRPGRLSLLRTVSDHESGSIWLSSTWIMLSTSSMGPKAQRQGNCRAAPSL